jgi:chromosome segregation ATPase
VEVARIQAERDRTTTADREIDVLQADIKARNPELSDSAARAQAIRERLSMMGRVPGDIRTGLDLAKLETEARTRLNADTEYLQARARAGSSNKDEANKAKKKMTELEAKYLGTVNSLRAAQSPTSAPSASSGSVAPPPGFERVR